MMARPEVIICHADNAHAYRSILTACNAPARRCPIYAVHVGGRLPVEMPTAPVAACV
jgi:hypothetical protein